MGLDTLAAKHVDTDEIPAILNGSDGYKVGWNLYCFPSCGWYSSETPAKGIRNWYTIAAPVIIIESSNRFWFNEGT